MGGTFFASQVLPRLEAGFLSNLIPPVEELSGTWGSAKLDVRLLFPSTSSESQMSCPRAVCFQIHQDMRYVPVGFVPKTQVAMEILSGPVFVCDELYR